MLQMQGPRPILQRALTQTGKYGLVPEIADSTQSRRDLPATSERRGVVACVQVDLLLAHESSR